MTVLSVGILSVIRAPFPERTLVTTVRGGSRSIAYSTVRDNILYPLIPLLPKIICKKIAIKTMKRIVRNVERADNSHRIRIVVACTGGVSSITDVSIVLGLSTDRSRVVDLAVKDHKGLGRAPANTRTSSRGRGERPGSTRQ